MKLTKSLLLPVVAVLAFSSFAETKTYVGSSALMGFFEDAANWSPEGVPGESDDVVIDVAKIVCITSNVKIASLTVGNGSTAPTLSLFATNKATSASAATCGDRCTATGNQVVPDINDTSKATFEVSGNVTLVNGRILVGAQSWQRNPEILIGGNFVSVDNEKAKLIQICAGPTNDTYKIEDGTAYFTVKGNTVIGNKTEFNPINNTDEGGGVVMTFADLDVMKGGSINSDGYSFTYDKSPGYVSAYAGGGYGGKGNPDGKTYGDYKKPYLPGSFGRYNNSGKNPGGGAVRIVATNILVNGNITANGTQSGYALGSGGGVCIKCTKLSGEGEIAADSGVSTDYSTSNGLGGGGGRVALEVEDEPGDDFQLKVSAAPAVARNSNNYAGDPTRKTGEAGTVYANRLSLIKAILPRSIAGVYYSDDFPSSFTNDVSEIPAKTHWYFPQADEIVFPGDVVFKKGSILGVGAFGTPGNAALGSSQPYTRYIGRKQKVVFLGDVTMETNTCLIVNATRNPDGAGCTDHSSECVFTGDLEQFGHLLVFGYGTDGLGINIPGDWTLRPDSTVFPISDMYKGGSVAFTVGGAFTMEEGAVIQANGRGYYYKDNADPIPPGQGNSSGLGGSYGGGNGNLTTKVYGNPFLPLYPGSCGGRLNNTHAAVSGGGLVRVHANSVSLDGAISANGISQTQVGSSGGGVLITSRKKKFSVGATAEITANGGNGSATNGRNGGGGRIALGIGVSDEQLHGWIAKLEELDDVYAEPAFVLDKKLTPYTADEIAAAFPGATLSAAGGANGTWSAEDGSVTVYGGFERFPLRVIVR